LLGYSLSRIVFITDMTTSPETDECSNISFVLDGPFHEKQAARVRGSYVHPPDILGVWHSHVCDIGRFSKEDRLANARLAEVLNGTFSMIVTCPNPFDGVTFYVYEIGADGRTARCIVK